MHLANGAPKQIMLTVHNCTLIRENLITTTTVINTQPDAKRLQILEAYLLKKNTQTWTSKTPALNEPLLLLLSFH